MRFCSTALVAVAVFFAGSTGQPDDRVGRADSARARKAILETVGDPDPAGPLRLSERLGSLEIRGAMYGESRTARLLAIDAAAYAEDPWPLLPYLAALMGARDRQTASRAAQSLITALSRVRNNPINRFEAVPGQARQLADQLKSLAMDARLDLDIRASSLAGVGLLTGYDRAAAMDVAQVLELLKDEDIAVVRAALAAVATPTPARLLSELAGIVVSETDPRLRGQAAALLCENAIAHGAKAPSKDLSKLLSEVLGDASIPGDGIGPILACLARFSADVRADLVDIAMRHPDPAVGKFADGLGLR